MDTETPRRRGPDWWTVAGCTAFGFMCGIVLMLAAMWPHQQQQATPPSPVEAPAATADGPYDQETLQIRTERGIPEWDHAKGIDIVTGNKLARTVSEAFDQ